MEFFVLYLVCAIVAAVVARKKGRSQIGWFVLSLLLTPLMVLVLLALPPVQGAVEAAAILGGEQKRCPYCAELIRVEAVRCRHCQADLRSGSTAASGSSADNRATEPTEKLSARGRAFEIDENIARKIQPPRESFFKRPVVWLIGGGILLLLLANAIRNGNQTGETYQPSDSNYSAVREPAVFDQRAAADARSACQERLLREPGITSAEIKVGPGLDGVVSARVNGEETYYCHATIVSGHVLIERIERVY